jgi:glucose-1-phosphatase
MIRVVMFDLGGVLERVAAAPKVAAWTAGRIPPDRFWSTWLSAESVRDFETGRISPDTFALRGVKELGLSITPSEFLDDFRDWLAGPYPGARDLVRDVRATGARTASFSNSNAIHWPIMERHQGTLELFDANFPSHRLGLCKPDVEAFLKVGKLLAVPLESILFLDDNLVNVEGARTAGMQADRVDGADGARAALVARGLLGG